MDRKDVEKVKLFRRNVERLLEIQKMIFFGSRARGDHLRSSDYDVIVVSTHFRGKKFVTRPVELYACWPFDEPLELLCYSPEEFEAKKKQIGTVRIAVKEGLAI